MSNTLYKLGRFAARRPWLVIGYWVILAVMVIGASSIFDRELTDSFDVPGLDSQDAIDLLAAADSEQAGITAAVVVTPLDSSETFLESAELRQSLTDLQEALAALPNVINAADTAGLLAAEPEAAVGSGLVSADGNVAILRLQYPLAEQRGAGDLDNLKDLVESARVDSPLQIEMAGELFFEFEEVESGMGEMAGVALAAVILLVAFGSLVAMGLPIGVALFGLGHRHQLDVAHHLSHRHPELGSTDGQHDRARRWYRLRPLSGHPAS